MVGPHVGFSQEKPPQTGWELFLLLLTYMCNCARSLEALRADAYELVPPGVRELVKLEVIVKTR